MYKITVFNVEYISEAKKTRQKYITHLYKNLNHKRI